MQDPQVVAIKQSMMASCSKRILLVDHDKFHRFALHALDDLPAFDTVLVTEGLPADQLETLTQAGIRLEIVRTSQP